MNLARAPALIAGILAAALVFAVATGGSIEHTKVPVIVDVQAADALRAPPAAITHERVVVCDEGRIVEMLVETRKKEDPALRGYPRPDFMTAASESLSVGVGPGHSQASVAVGHHEAEEGASGESRHPPEHDAVKS